MAEPLSVRDALRECVEMLQSSYTAEPELVRRALEALAAKEPERYLLGIGTPSVTRQSDRQATALGLMGDTVALLPLDIPDDLTGTWTLILERAE